MDRKHNLHTSSSAKSHDIEDIHEDSSHDGEEIPDENAMETTEDSIHALRRQMNTFREKLRQK